MAAKPKVSPINSAFAIEWWDVDRPKDYPLNARKWKSEAVAKVAMSLKAYGWRQPIVVDKAEVIAIGHLRRAAARQAGMRQVPVHVAADLSPEEIRGLRLADNRTHDEAEWDTELLAREFGELKALDFDLGATAFSLREIDSLTLKPDPNEDDVPPVPEVPMTKPGDLWVMGAHRLLCGDSTQAEDVARLMGDQLADCVFTDPPYGVGYDGGTTVREKLEGDENTDLYDPCCKMAFRFSKPKAALYLWHAGVKGIAAAAAAAAAGYQIRCELVWNKNLAQFGSLSAQYKQKHEPCYYCFKRGHAPTWYGPTNEVTVWDADRASVNDLHPTQKPVQIVERAIRNSSDEADIVLDLFGGSGSTMAACEQNRRACFTLEIAPSYCDVIVTRWENLTGKTATLDETHQTFAQVAQCPR